MIGDNFSLVEEILPITYYHNNALDFIRLSMIFPLVYIEEQVVVKLISWWLYLKFGESHIFGGKNILSNTPKKQKKQI